MHLMDTVAAGSRKCVVYQFKVMPEQIVGALERGLPEPEFRQTLWLQVPPLETSVEMQVPMQGLQSMCYQYRAGGSCV